MPEGENLQRGGGGREGPRGELLRLEPGGDGQLKAQPYIQSCLMPNPTSRVAPPPASMPYASFRRTGRPPPHPATSPALKAPSPAFPAPSSHL